MLSKTNILEKIEAVIKYVQNMNINVEESFIQKIKSNYEDAYKKISEQDTLDVNITGGAHAYIDRFGCDDVLLRLLEGAEEIYIEIVIIEKIIKVCEVNETIAINSYKKLIEHPDIFRELKYFLWNAELAIENIMVEGYTAKQLCETTYLKPLGAYNYLAYLRNNTKEALEDLRKGLPSR